MKGIILAAGDGGRLYRLTRDTPKVLMEMGGQRLIQYPLNALSHAGISEVAVVVGHQSEKIVAALGETHNNLTFVCNEDYDGDNALSIHAARQFVGDDSFVVCMGDHPIGIGFVENLSSQWQKDCVLCVDAGAWHPSQLNDGTRVMVGPDSCIVSIGKDLEVWNAIDTGVFMMTDEIFPAIEHLMKRQGVGVSITDVVRYMGDVGHPFATCDVRSHFWADIDTPEDFESVDRLLRRDHDKRV